jgi:hypothetical protein
MAPKTETATAPRIVDITPSKLTRLKRPAPIGIVGAVAESVPGVSPVGLDIIQPGINTCPSKAVSFHGGAIGTGDPVQLLFWGSTWATLPDPANPGQLLFNTFTAAVKSIMSGPWISGLRQYGIKRCSFGQALIASANPPIAPATFNEPDVQGVVQGFIDGGLFPEPDEPGGRNLYVVVLPPNTIYGPGGARGAHSNFDTGSIIDSDTAWYAWIGPQSLSGMTSTFCHEIAEMCTNPEGDGWFIDGAPPLCLEIGDLCNAVDGPLNGVNAESYWSVYDGACLIPTAWSVRRTLAGAGKKLGGKGLRSLQNPIPSMNSFIVDL